MKFELIKKGNLYYTKTPHTETLIPKDPNDDNIAYTNKAFACFDKLVKHHSEYQNKDQIEIVKSVII